MTDNQLDNLINRINKKVDRIRITLGTRSELFGYVASTMGLIKPLGVLNKGKYTIKRGKAVNSLTTNQRQQLEMLLSSVEATLNKRTLSDEKARLREVLKGYYGTKKLGRVTIKEYQKADRLERNMANSMKNAIEYFYNSNEWDSVEGKEALKIAKISGRRKSYDEMYRIVQLANINLKRRYANSPNDINFYGDKYKISDSILNSFKA